MLGQVAVLALLLGVALAAAPSPVVWPSQWNATWNFANTSTGASLDGGNWFYDAVHNMLRQDNHHKCDAYQKGIACSAVFRNNNMYYNLPSANFCCMCFKGLAITGPKWLSQATFVSTTVYNLTKTSANLWSFMDNTQWYYETAANRMPLALSGFGTDLQWIGILTGAQNPFVFSLPSTCGQQCPSDKFPECGSEAPAHALLANWMLYADD